MTRLDIALVVGVAAGWAATMIARALLRRLDVAAWVAAWNRVPIETRESFRDSLLSEEGI